MTARQASLTFVTAFSLILGVMLGMSALVGTEVEAAKVGGGYGVYAQDFDASL